MLIMHAAFSLLSQRPRLLRRLSSTLISNTTNPAESLTSSLEESSTNSAPKGCSFGIQAERRQEVTTRHRELVALVYPTQRL